MKRFLALAAAVSILATGCGSTGSAADPDDSGSAASTGSETAADYFEDCNGTVDFVVGYTAGGSTDTWARIVADHMAKETGAKFQVINAPGAGGSIGIQRVAAAKPDGCTIGNVNLPSALQFLFPNSSVTYDKTDFEFIGGTGYTVNAIIVAADSTYENVDDLIADAKSRPGQMNVASDGPGSDDAVAYLQLEEAAGIKLNQVVLDGGADKVTSLMGGQIDMFGGSITGALPQIRNNQLRVLCVYADQQSAFAPEAPTCESEGVDVSSITRLSMFMPVGTPENRRTVLEDALLTIADTPEYVEANEKAGIEIVPLSGSELSAEWDTQAAVYEQLTSKAG